MNAFTLKLIAVFFMLIDHIGYFFPNITPIWFRILGRISFPIFLFLFVESYHYTSNKKEYFNRLLNYSVIMMLVNFLTLTIFKTSDKIVSIFFPNIFLTFSMGFVILETIQSLGKSNRLTITCNQIFILIALITLSAFVEYDVIFIFSLFTFYFLREKKLIRNLTFIVFSIIIPLLINNPLQMSMLLSIIFINEYNNKKSNNKNNTYGLSKYFFYNFYIIHIFILNILSSI